MSAKYYNKPENVLFYNPITSMLAKIFGAKNLVIRCKTCKKIPTEVYDGYCFDHKKN